MRFYFSLLFLLFCQFLAAQETDLSAFNIPAALKENASSVVRDHALVYQAISRSEATIFERKVITVLDDNHGGVNRLVVHYDGDSKITKIKATLYDAFGEKVRSAKKSEIEDVRNLTGGQFYTDSRVQTTTLEHISFPYTVVFEYEKSLKGFGIVEFPNWLPLTYDQSVEKASFVARVPQGNELLYHRNQLPEPVITDDAGDRVYSWAVNNLPAQRYEADAPPLSQTVPYLKTGLKSFTVNEYEGSLENWQEFGKLIYQLMEGRNTLPGQLKQLVHETTAGLATEREKIDALYRVLQDRTRYVGVQLGIGGWQPFSAEYVEDNRYGDCKALSNYMGAMLQEIGVESYPVLVYSGGVPFFPVDETFTTGSAFNHMILYVPSEDMYLECTSKLAPTGYLGEGTDDRNVLWVTPAGGKLARTPAIPAAENSHLRTVRLDLDPQGLVKFSLEGRFYGATQDFLRYFASAERDETKQREILHRRGLLPDVTGTNYEIDCATEDPLVRLTYETELKNYVRKLGKRMFVPFNKLYAYDRVPDKLEERKLPIFRNKARFYVDTVHLTIPATMEVESLGAAVTEITHDAGAYRSEVVAADQTLTWVRTLKLLPVALPASAYEGYRQFFVDVAKADKRMIVIREKRTK